MHIRPLHLLYTLLVLLGTICYHSSRAATPSVHISARPAWLSTYAPYDKKIPARTVENGYFYQLVEEQINVELQADHRHIITEIVSEAGIQNGSQISISFDPAYERLDLHDITVWRNGVAQKRLKPGVFKVIADEEELSRFIYQGSYSAYCILDDIRKGDRIEYAYTITGRNPIFDGHFFKNMYFQWSLPVAHMYRSVLVSASRPLYFKYFNKTPQPKVTDKPGSKLYEWEDFQVRPGKDYEGQPGWHNEYAYAQVTDYRTWQEVANWALKVNPQPTGVKGKLAQEVAGLKMASGGNKEKYFRSATTFVQDEVRYMGIEMGEYSHRANSPEKVYAQRYGDCKDKARLLVAMLNANGIDAHMVLVNSDQEGYISNFLPSPNAFDHAVVTAVVNGKTVNVDATMSYQRGTGVNIYFPGYGKGLVVKASTNALTTLDRGKVGKASYTETYTIPNEKDSIKLDVTSVYTLNEADRIRDRLANKGMAETEKDYLNYYTKIRPNIAAADSVTLIDDPESNKITTVEHYRIPDMLKKDSVSGKYKASFYAYYINDQLINIANNAHVPLALNYPSDIEHTIHIILPSKWSIDEEHQTVKNSFFDLDMHTTTSGDTLSLNYKFSNLQDVVPVNQLVKYRQDANKATDELLPYTISYTPDVSQLPFHLNYGMAAWGVLLSIGLVLLVIKLYRTETDGIVFAPGAGFTDLGGWLILVAVGLFFSSFAILGSIINTGYFDMETWDLNLPGRNIWAVRSIFVFELSVNITLMGYTIFCLILLINRRDILPKHITGLYALNAIYAIADYALVLLLNNGKVSDQAAYSIIRALIFAAIWIPYFKRSERVEQTFIVPYPKHNYRYEELEPSLQPVTNKPE